MKALRFLLLQLVLLLVVGLAAIFAAEYVARRKFPELRYSAERQQRPQDLFMGFDATYGWANLPGADVRFQRRDFDTQVRINEDGFRGPRASESAGSEPASGSGLISGSGSDSGLNSGSGSSSGSDSDSDLGSNSTSAALHRPRIAVLGDSYVFGHGVEEDETFAARMRELRPDWEVLNFGVTGYSTDQELLLLENVVLPLEPNLVLVCLYRNDILDNGQATAWGLYRKPRFELDDSGELQPVAARLDEALPISMRARRWLRRNFVLYDVVAFRLAGQRAEGESGPSDAQALTRALLLRMADRCHDRGVDFGLVMLPGIDKTEFLADVPPASKGARVDLGPAFERHEKEKPDVPLGFTYDSHWNPTGHELVAQELIRFIENEGWLGKESF